MPNPNVTYQLTKAGLTVDDLLDLIGNDALTTTSQTLTGAVNELDSDISSLSTTTSANGVRYFTSQTVNVASNAELFRITDASVTTDTVVLSCVFANKTYITGDVTWTSYSGYVAFTGTCTTATTADVIIAGKVN